MSRREVPGQGHPCSNYPALLRTAAQLLGPPCSLRLFFDSSVFLGEEEDQAPLSFVSLSKPSLS